MSFEQIKRRVARREALVQARAGRADARLSALRKEWHDAWTPSRIVLVGLAAGFLAGRASPAQAVRRLGRGGRWMQMLGTLTSLFASVQSTFAAAKADTAVDHADTAATEAGDAADHASSAAASAGQAGAAASAAAGTASPPTGHAPAELPRTDRRRPDPSFTRPPAPAEAATDVSER